MSFHLEHIASHAGQEPFADPFALDNDHVFQHINCASLDLVTVAETGHSPVSLRSLGAVRAFRSGSAVTGSAAEHMLETDPSLVRL